MRAQTSALWAAGIAAALTVVACGSSGSGGSSASSAPASAPASQYTTAPAAANGALHGIVLTNEPEANTIQLVALDPVTGTAAKTRTFTGGAAQVVEAASPGAIGRQAFNADFTEIAANGPVASDGSQSAGVVNQQGVYKPLTASTSGGYGTPLRKSVIGFDPAGNLWYTADAGDGSPGRFGYVTPAGKDKLLPGSAFGGYGTNGTFELVPDGHGGYMPQTVIAHGDQVYLPGGPEVKRDPVDDIYQIAPYGKVTDMTPQTQVSGLPFRGIPWMTLPVDSHRFLSVGVETPPVQIYLGSLDGSRVHLHPLLPDSNRTLGDMVVSPDHTKVAFFSTNPGGGTQLFVTSLSSLHSQPHFLQQFNAPVTNTTGMLAWLP